MAKPQALTATERHACCAWLAYVAVQLAPGRPSCAAPYGRLPLLDLSLCCLHPAPPLPTPPLPVTRQPPPPRPPHTHARARPRPHPFRRPHVAGMVPCRATWLAPRGEGVRWGVRSQQRTSRRGTRGWRMHACAVQGNDTAVGLRCVGGGRCRACRRRPRPWEPTACARWGFGAKQLPQRICPGADSLVKIHRIDWGMSCDVPPAAQPPLNPPCQPALQQAMPPPAPGGAGQSALHQGGVEYLSRTQ